MEHKSFTLIEAVVTIAIILLLTVAFTPGLARRQQQVELDRTAQMIINGIYEARSLAISPTKVTSTGKVMQAWIMVMNMHPTVEQLYCYPVDVGTVPGCNGGNGYNIPPHTFTIFAAEDTNPTFTRYRIKQVNLPSNLTVFYDFPCHYPDEDGKCPASGGINEAFLWKVHFRHLDGATGYGGLYYNNPDNIGGYDIGYWRPIMWGNSCQIYDEDTTDCPKYSKMVIVGGNLGNNPLSDTTTCINGIYTASNLKCKTITVDNITGSINVGTN